MKEGNHEKGSTAEGTRRPRLLVRWSSNLQNLRFELESARREIESLVKAGVPDKRDKRGQAILCRCEKHLADAEWAFGKCLPRELFVWQMLFLIRQDLLLIVPAEELGAKWHSLERRLEQKATDTGCCQWKKLRDEITQRLESPEQCSGEQGYDLRHKMVHVRKWLDDFAVRDLWQNLQIRRYTFSFMVLGLVLTGALLAVVMVSPASEMNDGAGGSGWNHSAVSTMIAGAFGAILSALAPGKQFVATGVPLLTVVSAVRPVIGAAAGLFLYLLFDAGLLSRDKIDGAALPVLAVGFGFSPTFAIRPESGLILGMIEMYSLELIGPSP